MGPTGKFLKPNGEYTEEEFEVAYFEQARGLSDGGADFLLIETQYDLNEALCALRGVRKASDLPIFLTMTFNHLPKGFFTLMGNTVDQFLETMEREGVPVVGSNCTLNRGDGRDGKNHEGKNIAAADCSSQRGKTIRVRRRRGLLRTEHQRLSPFHPWDDPKRG